MAKLSRVHNNVEFVLVIIGYVYTWNEHDPFESIASLFFIVFRMSERLSRFVFVFLLKIYRTTSLEMRNLVRCS
jgi:hypothetical protein